jgi:type VI secretion system secreted protein VgrG
MTNPTDPKAPKKTQTSPAKSASKPKKSEPKATPKPSGFASARFFFKCEAYNNDELVVLGFEGSETLSRPFEFDIELVSMEKEVDLKKIVGEPASLKVDGPEAPRYVHGIVTRMELTDVLPKRSVYRVFLAPPLIKLEYKRRLRVYQKKSTQDIVKIALKEIGLGDSEQSWNIKSGDYLPRDYCVQYRETDLDFVNRLLCEDGITYHFSHDKKGVKVVFNDSPGAYKDIEKDVDGTTVIPYSDQLSMEEPYEFIHGLVFGRQMHVQHVQLREYDFTKPSVDTVGNSAKKHDVYSVYEYPGEFVEAGLHSDDLPARSGKLQKLSNRRSKLKQEGLAADSEVVYAASDSNRMLPGFGFTLGMKEPKLLHPKKWLNAKYLLTEVRHRGIQKLALDQDGEQAEPAYGNEIEFIPSKKQFRPPEVPAKPRVFGLHTALVVGPKGEEIYTDKYGRIKVKFHWEREASQGGTTGSCWIRVSQNWGGQGFGGMFIPRVGQEVLVSFLDGDPDRPIVIGRVYNGEQTIPYELPLHKTRSTIKSNSSPGGGGYNEIRFEDKKGAEEVYTHAQKDQNEIVLNNMTTHVGSNQSLTVVKTRTKTIGMNETTKVGLMREEYVGGMETVTIMLNRTHCVATGNDSLTISKGGQAVTVNKDVELTVKEGNQITGIHKGDSKLTVAKGSRLETISKGQHSVNVSSGNALLNVKKNREIQVAAGDYKVVVKNKGAASKGNMILHAAKDIVAFAKEKISMRGKKGILIASDKKIQLKVGKSSITIGPSSIIIDSPKVISKAKGNQRIKGSSVKIN